MKPKKKIKGEGWVEDPLPEYDEEFEKADIDLPQIPSLKKVRNKKGVRKFKLNGNTEGINLFSKKNNKSRKAD